MIKPFRFFAIFTINLCTALSSQLSHSDIIYTVKRWPLSQQLSQETILSIKHTDSGSLWIATLAGVDRFDGNSFTRYRPSTPDEAFIASANIFEILETLDRQILVVTKDAGLLIYDPKTDSFDSISAALDNFSNNKKISSSFIDDKNNVWLGYESGNIARFSLDTGSLKTFSHPSAQSVTGITQTASGQLLVATSKGGIFELTDKLDLRKIFEAENICSGFNSALDEMSAGPALSVWLGSNNDGIFFVDLAEMSCSQLNYEWKTGNNIDTSDIHHIHQTASNESTWVATDQGLFHIDRFFNIQHVPTSSDGKPEDEVYSIETMPSGNLWIGTFSGLRFLVPTVFEVYDERFDKNMHAVVAIDSNALSGRFIATYNGLFVYDAKSEKHVDFNILFPEAKLINEKIMTIHATPNGLWVGYRYEGIQYFSFLDHTTRSFNTKSNPAISSNSISSVLTLEDGTTVVGTYGGGLNLITADDRTMNISVGNNRVIMLHETSNGSILVGTESGLYEYHQFSKSVSEIEIPSHHLKKTRPLVWDITETINGDLLFATMHHGIYRWTSSAASSKDSSLIEPLYARSPPFDTVYALEKDEDGSIWSTTNEGLARINPSKGSAIVYSYRQGLPLSNFDFGVSHRDAQGFLHFGGNSGYTRFNPRETRVDPLPHLMNFTKILLPSFSMRSFNRLEEMDRIQISHDDHYITFEFAVMDFLNPERNQYRYMLEGFDEDWIENGTRNTATYTNLPAGDYVLRIQGANSAGIWNREGLSLDVHVSPPPWLSWWAYCLYAITLAIGFWLMKRAYDSYSIERRATARAAQMNLDAERAEDELQEQLEIQDQLVKSVYRHNVTTLDLIADFISPQRGGVTEGPAGEQAWKNVNRVKALVALEECVYHHGDHLLADLNKYTDIVISRLLSDSDREPETITTINEISSQPFPLPQASLLSVALYELLENAIQHAFPLDRSGNYLQIALTEEPGKPPQATRYRLTVEDNGICLPADFDPFSSSSPGLAIVRLMAEQLGGTLSFEARGGTRVTLSFPAAVPGHSRP
jgi:ligand-binding sensor domain-containing protein/two-component sensor histidine kinase